MSDVEIDHDYWCDANGCRCGKCPCFGPPLCRAIPPSEPDTSDHLADERADVLRRFTDELAKATGDGSRKRQAGTKPPWYEDDAHEVALFSHLAKWKRGEIVDPDSGAHTLVHLAWRALAIACRESGNTPAAKGPSLPCPHDWMDRNDGAEWRECFLCGEQESI